MILDFAAVLHILPEFVVSGVIAIIFYAEFKKPDPMATRPKFILVRGDSSFSSPIINPRDNSSSYNEKRKPFAAVLGDSQMIFLTVNLWILLTLVLLPLSNSGAVLPQLSSTDGGIIYGLLTALFAIAVITSVVRRFSVTRTHIVITMAAAAVVSYLSFYLPSMQWIGSFAMIMRIVIMYGVIAASVFSVYVISTSLRRVSQEKVAVVGTFASYGITAVLLFVNLFQSV